MFKKRLITISALPFVTALLLGSSLIISNKPEKVSAINDTHEHNDGWEGVAELPTVAGDYNIYLTDNITLTETWTVPEGITNLCLNGYVINENNKNYSVITIGEATTLNLYDCGDTSHDGYVDSNGLWHLGEGEGTAKAITGGIITGGFFEQSGKAGGGVYVGKGEFNMYGGTIAGNNATTNGGGVFVASGGKFTMSAGEIKFNKANNGGGVATQSGTIEINSGMITDNNATNGGGIFSYSGSTTITGGSICNNIATTAAGGVYQYCNLTLGGTAQIVGNTANGVSNNFYQPNGKSISFDTVKTPSEDMKIGLTLQAGKAKFTSDGVADYSSNFFSDKLEYGVKYNSDTLGSKYLELVDAYAITNNTKEADKATNNGYIEVKESAIEGEEVSINVVPNAGYKLKSLIYNDGTNHDITTELSFVMQTTPVSVTAEFEVKAEQVIEIGDISKIYDGLPINFDQYSSALSYLGDGEVTIEFKVAGASDETYTTDRPVNAGEYTVRVSVAESSTHSAGVKTKDFTISYAKINKVGFDDILQPVAGETAPTTIDGIAIGAKYTGSISWSPALVDGKFDCKTTYTVTITLDIVPSSIENYVFAEDVVLVKPNSEGWAKSTDSTQSKLVYTKEFEPTANHSVNKINGTNATCTEDGFKDAYHCETCGLFYENAACTELIGDETAYNEWILGDGKISASGHSMTHYAAVAPTCTEDGTVEYWICSHESGVYYADEQGTSTLTSIVDSKLGHDIVHHDAKAPSCTEVGWEAYDTCSRCDYSTYVEIPALGHSLSEVPGKSPTCTEDGYMVAYKCSTCEMYFTDPAGEHKIGDETTYNDWILGDGKISASGHSMTHHEAVAPTCTQDGNVEYWICSHESGVYYADEQGTSTLASIVDHKLGHDIVHHDAKAPTCTEVGWEAYDTCSRCDYSTYVEIPALGHSLSEVAGKLPTCTEDGYMVAYKCSTCEMYFTDPVGEHEIGDETAYNAWKVNEGKIQARHVVSKVSGVDPTKERSGYKEAWKCSECGQYFEDEACTILIGDETAYNVWKSARGYLPQLPNEGLSGGAIAGICVGSIFFLLLVIYLIGYFFLYRKGKLDEKKIKVIYKFLPRGENNLKENEN